MFKITRKEFKYGDSTCVLETGKVARQATAAVMATMNNTTVLVTVVAKQDKQDATRAFFPLVVNYQEKTYAAGRIPGGFLKREGRPSEKETLTSRLIDRPIRPLFPDGFMSEVQVIASVISTDKQQDPDIVAMIGTSAALAISGVPFQGPLAAARVGYINDMYVLNPGYKQLETSELDLVVAGTEKAVLMVESEAGELTEDQMLGAVLFGHQEMQAVIEAIKEFASEAAKPAWDWVPPQGNEDLAERVKSSFAEKVKTAYQITDKMARYEQLSQLKEAMLAEFRGTEEVEQPLDAPSEEDLIKEFNCLEKSIVRENVLSGAARIDGRDHQTVRPISIEVGVLQETHGSALFTRGETQALVVTTLGSNRDGQLIDALEGTRTDNFMLHYNFPPFCVGEIGMALAPKRREIGHGRLARRGLQAVLPDEEAFPYTIRVVSEITESNGSSSMASACGGSLALMDAGVPIKAPVAGVAMGLVKEGERFAVLTDILGDEDHLGDMDFKVVGTENGVTALQMDIKIEGITEEILEKALAQAREARLHILGEMKGVIGQSRESVSAKAPQFVNYKIDPDKIRDVIGKGGATIRSLCEETGAAIDISDDGVVKIYGEDQASCDLALKKVKELTARPEVGQIYEGSVERIVDFGAFVNFMPGIVGLVHISQIAYERVERVGDYLKEGQAVRVKVLDVDQRGRIKLSIKDAEAA